MTDRNEYDDLLTDANKYDAALQQDVQDERSRLRGTLFTALDQNPDQYARAKQIAPRTGVPAPVAARNLPLVDKPAKINEYDALLEATPGLRKRMAEPDFAALSHDDLDVLGQVEQAMAASPTRAMRTTNTVADAVDRVLSGGRSLVAGVPRLSAGLYGNVAGAFGGASRAVEPLVRSDILPVNPFAEGEAFFRDLSRETAAVGDYYAGDQSRYGFVQRNVNAGLSSLGQQIPGLAASVLTGNPLFVLGSATASTGGSEYVQARDAGIEVPQALTYAASQAAIEYATERIPAVRLLGDIKAGAPAWKTLVDQLGVEIPGEQAATILQDLNEWAVLHPEKPFSAYLEERPSAAAATLISTIVSTGGNVAIAKGIDAVVASQEERAQRAEEAQRQAMLLAQLADAAAQSKLAKRDPQSFSEFVQAAADENGAPSELFIDAKILSEVLAQSPVELPPEVAAQLPEALVTGGDVRIPVGDFAARIAQTDAGKALLQHLRTSPEAASQAEAEAFQQQAAEQFQKETEQVLAQKEQDDTWQASAAKVEADLLAQLEATRRFTTDVNQAYVKGIAVPFYSTLATRLGVAPEEAYAKFPLRVQAQTVEGAGFDQKGPAFGVQGYTDSALRRARNDFASTFGMEDGTTFSKDYAIAPISRLTSTEKVDEAKVAALMDYLRTDGSTRDNTVPPVVVDSRGNILDGHHRVEAARRLGYSEVPVIERYPRAEGPVFEQGALFQPAYHGTKHLFTKFRLSDDTIGTGEGAQAYGWGLYFAESPSIAESYRAQIAGDAPIKDFVLAGVPVVRRGDFLDYGPRNSSTEENVRASITEDILIDQNDLQAAANTGKLQEFVLSKIDDTIERYRNDWPEGVPVAERFRKAAARKGATKLTFDNQPGAVYTVEVPDGAVARMLAWDEPLGAQAPNVRELVNLDVRATRDGKFEVVAKVEDLVLPLGLTYAREDAARGYIATTEAGTHRDDFGERLYHALGNALVRRQANVPEGVDEPIAAIDPRGVRRDRLASAWLLKHGVPGARYFDQRSRDARDGTRNLVIFDDSLVTITAINGKPPADYEQETPGGWNIAETFAPGSPDALKPGRGSRGMIQFSGGDVSNGALISLMENADLSTFTHEMGHFFLEVLHSVARSPNATPELVSDFDTALRWFKIPGATPEERLATWTGYTLDQKRVHHEQWARGFEAYLFEGKSPNVETAGLFQRFRSWLVAVYKQLGALNVTLSDEVRGVFDRLLATDDAIATAQQARAFQPLFDSAKAAGMTEAEWADYQALGAEATTKATEQLQRKSLRDMQWLANAQSRALRELQRDAAEKRKAMRREVEAEVKREPVYAAGAFLRYGELPEQAWSNADRKLLDNFAGRLTKMNLPALKALYGEGPAAPWRYLPTGKFGLVTASEDGLAPDEVAELFGFTSGDHLVRSLLEAEPLRAKVEALTDRRMLEKYGDITSPEAMKAAANEAVHNEARLRFVATELRALEKASGQRKTVASAAREFAETIIARRKIRDVKPAQFNAAEARAARAAAIAQKAGKVAEAGVEKRNQLVNGYAFRAAGKALGEIEAGVRYLSKFNRDGTRKGLDSDYLDQIDQLLERYDLRRSVSNREADKRKALNEWVKAQEEAGLTPVIDEALLNEARRVPYRELSVEEFRGLVDAVRNIEHLGRLKKKLLTAKDAREFDVIVADAAGRIRDKAKSTRPVEIETARSKLDRGKELATRFFSSHRKLSSLVREMDGFEEGGLLWELFVRPMNAAGDFEASRREKATKQLTKLLQPVLDAGPLRTKAFIPELGTSLSREARIAIALNTGNETNRLRILEGDGWTPRQLDAVLNTLSKEEWDLVQGVWDYIDGFWPETAAKEKRVTGVEPEKVKPMPVVTRHGTFRGGYYPIKYDPNRSSQSEANDLAEVAKQAMQGIYTRATTRRGHTKARTESVKRPIRKDLGVVFEHVEQVVHDLAWHEWLIDANRLLRAKPIDSAIREHYGPETLRQMRDAFRDIAAGEIPAMTAFEASINHVRAGATIVGMGWNLTTSLLQPIGLTQSMVRIGPAWVGKGLARWIGDAARMESSTKWVYEKSDFMRLRGMTMQREISEIRNRVRGEDSRIEASYFYLIQKFQLVADMPTWLGAYEKAMAQFDGDEGKAIALADQAVLDAQGGGQVKDLAAIQRGSPLLKLFTNFYSYFNLTYNLTAESAKRTNFKRPGEVGLFAVDMLLLYTVPAVLGALLKEALRGGSDDEDELLRKLIADQLSYLTGTMVGLRELSGAVAGFYGYSGPAGSRFFAELAKLTQQTAQGEADEAFWKSLNNVAGMVFHYPAGQVQRTAEGTLALINGETENPGVLLVGPPKN